MNPFDYINSINSTKKDIMVDELAEKAYNPFMVNRGLSYFYDTVLAANEMNRSNQIDKRLQYSFLINIIRQKKRFSKWMKSSADESVETVKEYYGYSNEKAHQVLSLLSDADILELKRRVRKGGRKK